MRAVDMPITGDDKGMVGETLDRYRERWLQLHDMKTGGIMGLCLLAWKMPMRSTRTLDKGQEVFKFTRGVIVGRELHDIDKDIGRRQSTCHRISMALLSVCFSFVIFIFHTVCLRVLLGQSLLSYRVCMCICHYLR